MAAQIEVFPDGGKWRWRERDADGKAGDDSGADTRSETIRKARNAAEVEERVELFDGDGNSHGLSPKRPGRVRVVLLRNDGSEYGELDAGPSAGRGQSARVEAASEAGVAGEAN